MSRAIALFADLFASEAIIRMQKILAIKTGRMR